MRPYNSASDLDNFSATGITGKSVKINDISNGATSTTGGFLFTSFELISSNYKIVPSGKNLFVPNEGEWSIYSLPAAFGGPGTELRFTPVYGFEGTSTVSMRFVSTGGDGSNPATATVTYPAITAPTYITPIYTSAANSALDGTTKNVIQRVLRYFDYILRSESNSSQTSNLGISTTGLALGINVSSFNGITNKKDTIASSSIDEKRINGKIFTGTINFNERYLDKALDNNYFEKILAHHILHLLGMSSSHWNPKGVTLSGTGPNYTMSGNNQRTLSEWTEEKHPDYALEPLTTDGSHWMMDHPEEEIMKPEIGDREIQPISSWTLGMLKDMGYSIATADIEANRYLHSTTSEEWIPFRGDA